RGRGTRRRARRRHAHRAGRPARGLPPTAHRRSHALPPARGQLRRHRPDRRMTGAGRSRFAAALLGLAVLVLLPACAEDESITQRDRRLLAADVAALAPQRPGSVDLYVVGFAGDSTEDVFRNEVAYLDTLASNRFDARGVVTLVN